MVSARLLASVGITLLLWHAVAERAVVRTRVNLQCFCPRLKLLENTPKMSASGKIN